MGRKASNRFFENKECGQYPCHKGEEELNCLFCYCPLYHFADCPGSPSFVEKNGRRIKSCMDCAFPHRYENYERIMECLRKGEAKCVTD